jgi:hypothetical protein
MSSHDAALRVQQGHPTRCHWSSLSVPSPAQFHTRRTPA